MFRHNLYFSRFEKYFFYYIILIFLFSVFYLIRKHDVGNDSTIAEWLINYSGGFTKRGIIGQFSIFLSEFFKINLRDVILIFQVLTVGIYYFLILLFFKNIKINRILLLAIFTPIFILYPVAEIEVLARKETFIFSIFILYILLKELLILRIFQIFVLSLAVLIWEPVIFYYPFFLAVDLINQKLQNIDKNFIKNLIFYLPSIFLSFYIALNPLDPINHQMMASYLKLNFNENCYMACELLKSKSTILDQFKSNYYNYSPVIFFRYSLIILVGFGPLILLTMNSRFQNKDIFLFKNFKNIFFPFLILLTPVIILFAMGADWGRWVNISYVFSIILYIYLYKQNLIVLNKDFINSKFYKILNKKSLFVFIFLIFCFSWNPKTVLTADVATNPLWKIPYNTSKHIFGFESLRLFENSPIMLWHKKFIE